MERAKLTSEKFRGRPLVILPIAIFCALALAAAGCGGGEEESASSSTETSTESTADAGGDGAVAIFDFKYDPDQVTVEAGTTVVWANEDDADHTATADDDTFDTGVFGKGEEGEATLDEPGTFAYHCDLHPFMKGEVVVE